MQCARLIAMLAAFVTPVALSDVPISGHTGVPKQYIAGASKYVALDASRKLNCKEAEGIWADSVPPDIFRRDVPVPEPGHFEFWTVYGCGHSVSYILHYGKDDAGGDFMSIRYQTYVDVSPNYGWSGRDE